MRLHHLVFTGADVAPAELEFVDGLNIIFGASNTGKSFASKSILFMLGASGRLPETDEIKVYDAVWMGITLGDQGDFTLYRATQGGNLKIYPGLIKGMIATNGMVLRDKHDRNRTDTVSHRLLEAIGLAGKWIVRDGNGTKDSLSIRMLSKYLVVAENDILAEESPVFLSGSPAERSAERNIFKLLLTGKDDSAVVAVPKSSERKVAKAAKIELVDEMLAQLDAELSEVNADEQETKDQLARLDESVGGLHGRLRKAQKDLDEIVVQRRSTLDQKSELQERAGELELTLQRFAKLQAIYASDLDRLHSIEESGFVLAAMAARDCSVCGAPPDAQTHNHAGEEISMAYKAAAAEARKIEREQGELVHVIASLDAEAHGLLKAILQLEGEVKLLNSRVEELRIQEASLQASYETYTTARVGVVKAIELFERRAKLAARRAEICAEPTRSDSRAQQIGPDSATLFDFGETVKSVLKAWKFPDAEKVQFDPGTNDITIGGKPRAANGKGVRAILHSAFKVAVFVHCIENKLPHPGFLVLDTPLLTYREPLTSKHGELAQDEQTLKSSSLAEHFYRHLASLKAHVQVIVIENSNPPQAIRSLARIETFTGQPSEGRFGLLARA